jgi:hypothetical protein
VDSSKLSNWLQVAANIGIVLGLVMVGIQVKQNSDLTRIQLLYEESNRAVNLESLVVGEQAAQVWAKMIEDPENLTLTEIRIIEALLWSFTEQLRGTYRLAEMGLLTDADWKARVKTEVTFYFSDRYSRAWWENFGTPSESYPEELRQAINDVIASDTTTSYDYITTPLKLMKSATVTE